MLQTPTSSPEHAVVLDGDKMVQYQKAKYPGDKVVQTRK